MSNHSNDDDDYSTRVNQYNIDSVITNFTLNTVTDVSGVEIINQTGTDVSGNYITNTFLTTLDPFK